MDQIHEYKNLISLIIAEGMSICDYFQANALIEKLPFLGEKEYKKNLRHKKNDMKLQELVTHIKIEDVNRSQEPIKTNASNSIVIAEYKNACTYKSGDQDNKCKRFDGEWSTATRKFIVMLGL